MIEIYHNKENKNNNNDNECILNNLVSLFYERLHISEEKTLSRRTTVIQMIIPK